RVQRRRADGLRHGEGRGARRRDRATAATREDGRQRGLARAAVVTVSTRVSRGEAEDESGPALAELCAAAGLDVVAEVVTDDRVALDRVSFALKAGQTLAVLGPNGAGKTTLLKVLATLLRPHEGEVRVLGSALPAEAWKVRGQVGYLGHEPVLYRSLSARENL